ncbi:MAG TPA: hypothetical protein VKY85_01300 [Candidatus Angelobacter sp.]|nr:hypothetical protein [Candidatus Angelobacter sp.]
MPTGDFITGLKNKLPKGASLGALLASLLLTCLNGVMNFAATRTHFADVQQEQERRLTAVEATVKNDFVTRNQLTDFKADATKRLDRIEEKLDQELESHRITH